MPSGVLVSSTAIVDLFRDGTHLWAAAGTGLTVQAHVVDASEEAVTRHAVVIPEDRSVLRSGTALTGLAGVLSQASTSQLVQREALLQLMSATGDGSMLPCVAIVANVHFPVSAVLNIVEAARGPHGAPEDRWGREKRVSVKGRGGVDG